MFGAANNTTMIVVILNQSIYSPWRAIICGAAESHIGVGVINKYVVYI